MQEDLPSLIPKHYLKNETFVLNYKTAVHNKTGNFTEETIDNTLLTLFELFVDSANEAAEKTFTHHKNNTFSKHWWTHELTKAKSVLSTHFKEWKNTG